MRNVNLYSGQARFIEENIESLKMTQLAEVNNDNVFCFWDDTDRCHEAFLRSHLPNVTVRYISARFSDQEIASRFDGACFNDRNFINHIHQYDALQQAFQIASEVIGENDQLIVTRSRTDLFVYKVPEFPQDLVSQNTDIRVPGAKFGIGLTDYFATGNFYSMGLYCNLLDTILELADLGLRIPPEVTLGLHLQRKGCTVGIDRALPSLLLSKGPDRLTLKTRLHRERGLRFNNYTGSAIAMEQAVSSETLMSELMNRFSGFFTEFRARKILFSRGKYGH